MYFQRIADLRSDHDLTQQQIADYLICNRQVYARYENGISEIPISLLIKLAQYYDVDLNYICGLTNERKPFPDNKS